MEEQDSAERIPALMAFPLMHRLMRVAFEGEPERFTKTQFYILTALYARETLTMTGLSELIGASKEQATRAVAPLADLGLVERSISSQNRTRVYVRLTETGRSRVQMLLKRCEERMRERMDAFLTPEEQAALQAHLSESAALLQKIVE